jgi:uncharacterized protein (TIGR00730 family)
MLVARLCPRTPGVEEKRSLLLLLLLLLLLCGVRSVSGIGRTMQQGGTQYVCVFCGSKEGRSPAFATAASDLAHALLRHKLGLVYGGGTVGLMGILSRSVHEGGGQVFGVIPEALKPREVSGPLVGHTVVVHTMHERKALMASKASFFIALPGGFGTFEELFEVITWVQLGILSKPIGLLNVEGYYDPLVAMLKRAHEENFIPAHWNELVLVAEDPESLVEKLLAHRPPPGIRKQEDWVDGGKALSLSES